MSAVEEQWEAYQALAVDFARDVVASQAPEELPLFAAMSRAYERTPESVLRRVVGHDEALGFGVEAFAAITPFALALASTVVSYLAQQALAIVEDASSDAGQEVVRGWIARLRRRTPEAQEIAPPLTPQQLARVRELAYERARQLDVSEAQSRLLADAMVGGLALPQ